MTNGPAGGGGGRCGALGRWIDSQLLPVQRQLALERRSLRVLGARRTQVQLNSFRCRERDEFDDDVRTYRAFVLLGGARDEEATRREVGRIDDASDLDQLLANRHRSMLFVNHMMATHECCERRQVLMLVFCFSLPVSIDIRADPL